MSVLHSRITSDNPGPDYHPAATAATPTMVPPQAFVMYQNGGVLYGSLHPLYTTDGAVVPARADVRYPTVQPAGRHV